MRKTNLGFLDHGTAARSCLTALALALVVTGAGCGETDGEGESTASGTTATASGTDSDTGGSATGASSGATGSATGGSTGNSAGSATGGSSGTSAGTATTGQGCGAKVDELCNPDVCGCDPGPEGFIVCRLNPAGESVCVDTTPQNKPVGNECTYNFECTSEHCYNLADGAPTVCQEDCVPADTEVPSAHTGNVNANCCGGFAQCSNGSCICG